MKDEKVDEVVRGLELPGVAEWYIETGPDATGDDAVWVWLILEEEDVDFDTRSDLRRRVFDGVREAGGETPPWVYVRFRTVAEERPA